jgi:hypothetical protein
MVRLFPSKRIIRLGGTQGLIKTKLELKARILRNASEWKNLFANKKKLLLRLLEAVDSNKKVMINIHAFDQ